MTPFDVFIVLLVIIILIGLTGLYVAAEFSAVSASKARLAQMAAEGNQRAALASQIIEDPKGLDDFIAACQLGITLAGLILGFYGQAKLTGGLNTILEQMGESVPLIGSLSPNTISTILILFVLTVVTVLLGELIPKNLGVQMPEQMLLLTLTPMRWSMWIFRPLIWFFNGSGALILRLFGVGSMSEHAHIHSPEEIQMLVEESNEGGVLDRDERMLLVNTLQLRDVTARKVMIPRNRMLTAEVNQPPEVLLERLARSRYSRMPLHEGTIDKIVGFVHLKDLLRLTHAASGGVSGGVSGSVAARMDANAIAGESITIRDVMRPVVILPETIAVEGILESMQRDQNYMVIVADEYGGTSGMITVEDLFEEIIGEFYDEFDQNRQLVHIGPENRLFVNGDIQVDDLNEWLDFHLPEEEADTVGGLIFSLRGKLPDVGDVVSVHARGAKSNDSNHHADHHDGSHDHADAKDETSLLEKLATASASATEPTADNGSGHSAADSEPVIEIRVEKMQDNGVSEVSFQIADREIELLHKHEIF